MTWTASGASYYSGGYRAAQVQRQSGRGVPMQGSGDAFLSGDGDLLAVMGDEFDRSNGVYAGIVRVMVDGVVGPTGFTLEPTTGNGDLDTEIVGDWLEFAKKPEVRGIFPFRECERLVLRAVVNNGDIGAIKLRQRKFQYVESHRITGGRRAELSTRKGGRVDRGVEMDRYDTPKAYWVAPYNKWGTVTPARARRIRSSSFIHTAYRKRFSQTRGVPALTESFSMVNRISDVLDAEAIAWQLIAKFAVAFSTEGGAGTGHALSSADKDGRDAPPDLANRYVETEEGSMFFGKPGESVRGVERNIPSRDFPASVKMFLRMIGLPLGLPLELVLALYSDTNYTSLRGALEQAWASFKAWQALLKEQHHTPVYETWMGWQLAAGKYAGHDPATIYSHSWDANEFPWIDQLKEAEAWSKRTGSGLALHDDALKSLNTDRRVWLPRRIAEVETAREAARLINSKNKDDDTISPVDWHEFAGITPPPASSPMVGTEAQAQPVPSDDDDQPGGRSVAAAVQSIGSRINGNGGHP